MTPRNLDTNQITSKLVAKEALGIIDKVIDIIGKALSAVPEVGEAIDAVATLTSAGIDVTEAALTDIIEFTSDDRFVNGQNGKPAHDAVSLHFSAACLPRRTTSSTLTKLMLVLDRSFNSHRQELCSVAEPLLPVSICLAVLLHNMLELT